MNSIFRSLSAQLRSPDAYIALDLALDLRNVVTGGATFWPSVLIACGGLFILGTVGAAVWWLPRKLFSVLDREDATPLAVMTVALFRQRRRMLLLALLLVVSDLALRWNAFGGTSSWWLSVSEFGLALWLSVVLGMLVVRAFALWFDAALVGVAAELRSNINGELLVIAKLLGNGAIIFVIALIFAETHDLNAVGLLTSLGVGGLAVAFAAQKTLEQIVGGIVLYVDRPFLVDDYIALPDKTFGRVESIGLRSTKIRVSGKGTVMVVPNNVLTGEQLENYSGAKKLMATIVIDLFSPIPEAERALIERVILNTTSDIFGLDPRSTTVTFVEPRAEGISLQVKVTLFILGSGTMSMDLRRQLLDIARQNISQTLLDYGTDFAISDAPTYVDTPISL